MLRGLGDLLEQLAHAGFAAPQAAHCHCVGWQWHLAAILPLWALQAPMTGMRDADIEDKALAGAGVL